MVECIEWILNAASKMQGSYRDYSMKLKINGYRDRLELASS